MDVEGTEFDLIHKMVETGAICLIDEMFLKCHYNRWERCCKGERSSKYHKEYNECMELFSSLREKGVLLHYIDNKIVSDMKNRVLDKIQYAVVSGVFPVREQYAVVATYVWFVTEKMRETV
ncbi:hypothetical protein L2E82_17729 [Cichorium intybus]|uniref:Uncharacterized protein n=1 Tax=Cichorium intybus TaxID=13427 RepID=A0ACB9F9N1_CICIN|nr:hypothetical protein L2E82_17729 [Cichorium intybus]